MELVLAVGRQAARTCPRPRGLAQHSASPKGKRPEGKHCRRFRQR